MIVPSDFKAHRLIQNPHLQTLLAVLIPAPDTPVTAETITLDDGDILDLLHGPATGDTGVLILHGLEARLDNSPYLKRVLKTFEDANIPATLMFFRGCSGRPNKLARSYHSGETGDLKQVIQHQKQRGLKKIILVGFSLGGNVLLKYLGNDEVDESVIAGCAVSVPMRLDICAKRMNHGFSRFYQKILIHRILKKLKQKQPLMQQQGINFHPYAVHDFKSLDNLYTAPVHGFVNADDYYQKSSSRQFLNNIHTPTLIIHSLDDPFMTRAVIPEETELSASVTLELTQHGGHVGFIGEKGFGVDFWLMKRILSFVEAMLKKLD